MVILGLILIAVVVLLALGVGISSGHDATLEVFGVDLDVTAASIFFTGLLAGLAGVVGLWLLKKGTGRTYRRRKEVKELRQQVGSKPAAEPEPAEPAEIESDAPADGPGPATTR
jgi:hypothetical protein